MTAPLGPDAAAIAAARDVRLPVQQAVSLASIREIVQAAYAADAGLAALVAEHERLTLRERAWQEAEREWLERVRRHVEHLGRLRTFLAELEEWFGGHGDGAEDAKAWERDALNFEARCKELLRGGADDRPQSTTAAILRAQDDHSVQALAEELADAGFTLAAAPPAVQESSVVDATEHLRGVLHRAGGMAPMPHHVHDWTRGGECQRPHLPEEPSAAGVDGFLAMWDAPHAPTHNIRWRAERALKAYLAAERAQVVDTTTDKPTPPTNTPTGT